MGTIFFVQDDVSIRKLCEIRNNCFVIYCTFLSLNSNEFSIGLKLTFTLWAEIKSFERQHSIEMQKRDTFGYCWVLTDLSFLSEQTITFFKEGQLKNRRLLNRLVLEKNHPCPCRISFFRVSESLFCCVAILALCDCSVIDVVLKTKNL